MIASELMQTDFIKIDVNDKVSSLVGTFRKNKSSEAVVLKNGVFEGIIGKRLFLRLRQNIGMMKIRDFVLKVPKLKPSTSAIEIVSLMNSADTHILPIVEGGDVKGVVNAFDLLKFLRASFKGIKVFELIQEPLIVLKENAPISKAINFFKQKKIGHIPIVDEKDKLIGIISITNLITKYYLFPPKREQRFGGRGPKSHTWKQEDITKLPVKNEITPLVCSVSRSDSLTKVIDLFNEKKISSVVVIEDNEVPVGIVTIKDLLKLYTEL